MVKLIFRGASPDLSKGEEDKNRKLNCKTVFFLS